MKKYKFRTEIGIADENTTPIKELSMNLYVNAEQIPEKDILDTMEMIACSFCETLAAEVERANDEESDT